MKKLLMLLLTLGMMGTFAHAEMKCAAGKCGAGKCGGKTQAAQPKKMMPMFQSVEASQATLLQEGDAKAFCPNCGMTLPMFYKTNHAATVEGKTKQYCSIHCLAEDIQKGLNPTDIKVVDVTSLKFIDAAKAHYVVGSKMQATMSMVSKYAFEQQADAEAFAKANGGEVVNFESALGTAKNDFAKDNEMVSKKQAMMTQKGEALYGKMCKKTDKKFATTAEAKAFVQSNNLCEGLDPVQLQAVGLYLKNR